jgi:hypothetical protein
MAIIKNIEYIVTPSPCSTENGDGYRTFLYAAKRSLSLY